MTGNFFLYKVESGIRVCRKNFGLEFSGKFIFVFREIAYENFGENKNYRENFHENSNFRQFLPLLLGNQILVLTFVVNGM